jgi:glutamine synthetase
MKPQQILDQVKKDHVKSVSLQFNDLHGVMKEVIIPANALKQAIGDGLWFDGSSIEGFSRIQESDQFLKPDLNTYSLVPWLAGEEKTARLICDIYQADEKPFEGDPRYILKKAVAEVAEMGYEFDVGPEPEFYIFTKDPKAVNTPLDFGSYFDLSSHLGYKIIDEVISALNSFGISVETAHHEVGHGQYEIDLHYGPCLDIADKLLTLKYTVKKITQMNDLQATFMPKPIYGAAGNGMHVHQSLKNLKTKTNSFYDEKDKYKLSKIAYNFIAGQISHIKEITAIICPTVSSYKRLVSGFEAPVYITWGGQNRSALIRVPQWFKQKPESARIELRCPDPSCNPYLAFAVMLKAGLAGIKEDLLPPDPVEQNVYQFDDESLVRSHIETLPTTLFEALDHLKKSKLVHEMMGDHLFEKFIEIKTMEWNEYKTQVTSWELDKYLKIY